MSTDDDFWGSADVATATADVAKEKGPRDPITGELITDQAPTAEATQPAPPINDEIPPVESQNPQPTQQQTATPQQPPEQDPLKQQGRAKIAEIVRNLGEQRGLLEGMKEWDQPGLADAVDGLKDYLTQHATLQVVAIRDEHGLVQKPGQDRAKLSQDGPVSNDFKGMSKQEQIDYLLEMRNHYSDEITNDAKRDEFTGHLDTVLNAMQGYGQEKTQQTSTPDSPPQNEMPPEPPRLETPPQTTENTLETENTSPQMPATGEVNPPVNPTSNPTMNPNAQTTEQITDPEVDSMLDDLTSQVEAENEVRNAMQQPKSKVSGVRIDPELMAMLDQMIQDGRATGLSGSLPSTVEKDMKKPAMQMVDTLAETKGYGGKANTQDLAAPTVGTKQQKATVGRE